MGIKHGLISKDMNHEEEAKFNMKEVSKMIEEAVSKAMESKGLRLENDKASGKGNGNGQGQGMPTTMSPELVAILLNNQKARNAEEQDKKMPDMICYRCGGIGVKILMKSQT